MVSSLGREFRDLGEDFRAEPELATLLRDLLQAGVFASQIFDYSGIEDMIKEHYELKRQSRSSAFVARFLWPGGEILFYG